MSNRTFKTAIATALAVATCSTLAVSPASAQDASSPRAAKVHYVNQCNGISASVTSVGHEPAVASLQAESKIAANDKLTYQFLIKNENYTPIELDGEGFPLAPAEQTYINAHEQNSNSLSYNKQAVNGDLILKRGEQVTATWTYTVTQTDVDNGHVSHTFEFIGGRDKTSKSPHCYVLVTDEFPFESNAPGTKGDSSISPDVMAKEEEHSGSSAADSASGHSGAGNGVDSDKAQPNVTPSDSKSEGSEADQGTEHKTPGVEKKEPADPKNTVPSPDEKKPMKTGSIVGIVLGVLSTVGFIGGLIWSAFTKLFR